MPAPKPGAFRPSCHPGKGAVENPLSRCLNSGFPECKRRGGGRCPGFQARRGKEPGPRESAPSSPDGQAPTFLELYLKDVRDVGGFGRVLGLCVQAWRRLVLTKHRNGGAAQSQAVPRQALDTLRPSPEPGGFWHSPLAGPVQQASQPPARSQPCLPGAWETKGSRNQTIFPLNLISSFSLTPPQLEVE